MNSLILLLFAVDPLGFQTALESAEKVDLLCEGFTVTLVNPDTIKKLAPLLPMKGEVTKGNAIPGISQRIDITIGEKKFWLTRGLLGSEEGHIDTADEKLRDALFAYFQEDAEKTLQAAMNGADKIQFRFKGGESELPLSDSIKKVWVRNLVLAGDVTSGVKVPEDAVGLEFINKETELRIFVLGDTAYWGNRSVKLTKDTMWKQARKLVKPK